MKQVVFVRHAESEWAAPFEKDLDRSLTEEGKADANRMAAVLRLQQIRPDKIYSSPARRAIQTAEIFINVIEFGKKEIIVHPLLYTPSTRNFYDVIEHIPEDIHTVVIFSHNPGITEFMHELDCCPDIHMPPCGMVAIAADTADWRTFQAAGKRLLFCQTPEMLLQEKAS